MFLFLFQDYLIDRMRASDANVWEMVDPSLPVENEKDVIKVSYLSDITHFYFSWKNFFRPCWGGGVWSLEGKKRRIGKDFENIFL